jgi:hypothetical protein
VKISWRTNLQFSHEQELIVKINFLYLKFFFFEKLDRVFLENFRPILDSLGFRVPKQSSSPREVEVLFRDYG